MDKNNDYADSGMISCEMCLKEVPVSEASIEEAADYVAYYCGLECYAQWKNQDKSDD